MDARIVYLYSVLPYLEPAVTWRVDFLRGGGSFADFRDEGDVMQGRNPMHADDEDTNQWMRPWMTPLSVLGKPPVRTDLRC